MIGRDVRGVAASDALGCVAGYAIGLDITIRGMRIAACASRRTATACSDRGS